ncbi:MAG: leucine-rich repeat protein [Ruminococcus sp.]|nr:leucine-rich repeat protein [Ruminococcus sp.]
MTAVKKITSFLTAGIMLFSLFDIPAVFAEPAADKTDFCGDKAEYTLSDTDGDGFYDFLLIDGAGAMTDYTESDYNDRPFLVQAEDNEYGEKVNRHIKEVFIAEGVTSVGDYAFGAFCGLERVSLPSTLKKIGDVSFVGTDLKEITLPEGLESIGERAFQDCVSLTAVSMPDSLKTIGDNAFRSCFALAAIEIPNGVETVGKYAFSDCYALTSIEIPNSVQTVGSRAFSGCISLKQLIYPSGLGCGSFTPSAATIEYSVNGGKVVIDKISLGDDMTETAVPDTVCGVPVAEVDENYRQYVSETGHTHVVEKAASCTQKAVCAICGEYGEPLGHSYTNYISDGNAACTENGTETAKCDNCDETDTRTAENSATGHSFSENWSKDETNHWHAASCGHTEEISDKAAHAWNDGTVTKEPTETAEGVKTYVCTVCSYEKTESIPKLDVTEPTETAPTVTEPTETDPTATEPPVTEPTETNPTATEPPVTEPTETNPTVTEPPVTEPTATEPVTASPNIPSNYQTAAVTSRENAVQKMIDTINAAADGSVTEITLGGAGSVDKSVFEAMRGRDITVVFKLNGGAYWTINGKDIAKAKTVDLGIRLNRKAVSANKVKELAGDKKTVQFTLKHNGDFGFTGILNVPFGKKYNGKLANLYYCNNGGFEFVNASQIEGGSAKFVFTHASDYVAVIDDFSYIDDVSSGAGTILNEDSAGINGKAYIFCGIAATAAFLAAIAYRKKITHK